MTNNNSYEFRNTPHYDRSNSSLVLIGVTHSEFGNASEDGIPVDELERRIDTYRGEILGLDQLAVESNESNWLQLTNPTDPNTFESIARQAFTGQYHYLDQDSDYTILLQEQGISPYLFGPLEMLRHIPDVQTACPTWHQFETTMTETLRHGKETASGYQNIEVEKVIANMAMFLAPMMAAPTALRDFFEAGVAFNKEYLGRIRDSKVYAPRIRRMLEQGGNAGAVLGKEHIDPISRILKGEIDETEYLDWERFKQSSDPNIKATIELIEQFAEMSENMGGFGASGLF